MAPLLHRAAIKKLKPNLVAYYNIRPGNGEGIFWFRCFINLSLTYLVRHLPTYLQPKTDYSAVNSTSVIVIVSLMHAYGYV